MKRKAHTLKEGSCSPYLSQGHGDAREVDGARLGSLQELHDNVLKAPEDHLDGLSHCSLVPEAETPGLLCEGPQALGLRSEGEVRLQSIARGRPDLPELPAGRSEAAYLP